MVIRVSPLVITTAILLAQSPAEIRTTVPLAVAPTRVTDRSGRYIDGLSAADFQVFDPGARQTLDADVSYQPLSVVISVQMNLPSFAAVFKIARVGSTIEPLVTGERGVHVRFRPRAAGYGALRASGSTRT